MNKKVEDVINAYKERYEVCKKILELSPPTCDVDIECSHVWRRLDTNSCNILRKAEKNYFPLRDNLSPEEDEEVLSFIVSLGSSIQTILPVPTETGEIAPDHRSAIRIVKRSDGCCDVVAETKSFLEGGKINIRFKVKKGTKR